MLSRHSSSENVSVSLQTPPVFKIPYFLISADFDDVLQRSYDAGLTKVTVYMYTLFLLFINGIYYILLTSFNSSSKVNAKIDSDIFP